jgi:Nucleotidyl transferase AbiEii toxin, Type IV TA system
VTAPVADVLAMIAAIFDSSGLGYALIGGHAINAWLEPRFTADIDVTVAANPAALARARAGLEAAGYRVNVEHGAEQASGPDFVRFVRAADDPPIELQAAKTELQHRLITRARRDEAIAIATPEDLIVLKLIAHRPKDLADLAGLLALPAVDWDYVEQRAREWAVDDRLAILRAQGAT